MTVEIACAYLGGLSREVFFAAVAVAIHPVIVRGVALYDRKDLDAWVDARGEAKAQRSDSDWLRELENADD
jgi:hypothetical protein